METPNLFPAPDEYEPDETGERDQQDTNPDDETVGGEYILHFRDTLGRFALPPAR